MTFHASLSLVGFSASVTLFTLSHFVSPSNIFLLYILLLRFPSIIPVGIRCSSSHLLMTWPKWVAHRLLFLFRSDLVVSASCNTVSFELFAVYEICSFILSPVSFVAVLKLPRPRIIMGSIKQPTVLPLV